MFGVTCGEHQQSVGELSPPYDGSEMDLFPDLSFLDSVQSDFLNNGFDELASLPPPTEDSEGGQAQHDPVLQGIVSPSKNPTLLPTSAKGKSVIKVIVNSSKDETELVKYLMGKAHDGPAPKLRIIKKLNTAASAMSAPEESNQVVTTTTSREIKVDSARPLVSASSSSIIKSRTSTKSKEISLIEQLEKELQDCDPMNRNAIAARLNRLRKKNHVEALEENVRSLQTDNSELFKQNKCLNAKVSSLETEVSYLKSILANQSSLSSLLSNIQATNLNFHTSMDTVQNISEEDIDTVFQTKTDDEEIDVVRVSHDQSTNPQKRKRTCVPENPENKKAKKTSSSSSRLKEGEQRMSSRLNEQMNDVEPAGGVCLHVSGKNVSLEFCSHCSRKAQSTIQMSTRSQQLIKDEV